MDYPGPFILVSPLDWGLGHATRCIPLIHELLRQEARVMVAAEGSSLTLLREAFPDIAFVELRGYRVKYHHKIPAAISLLFDIPRLIRAIRLEHQQLKKLVEKHQFDAVISDNRYGLWHREIYSILITHQLNVISPILPRFFNPFLGKIIRRFIRKFNQCWVPDFAGEPNLSGKLSHGASFPENVKFIGLLSRFQDKQYSNNQSNKYDLVAIVSGPEPQRSIFENLLLAQLPLKNMRCLLIRGLPGETATPGKKHNLEIIHHLPAGDLADILHAKPIVICRSGYSTLMDLSFTGNKAILVPTPGQTEQEYLARYHANSGNYLFCEQNSINLGKALEQLKLWIEEEQSMPDGRQLLTEQVARLIEDLHLKAKEKNNF